MTGPVLRAVLGVNGWEIFVRLVTIVFIGISVVHLLPPSVYPRRSTRGGWTAAAAVLAAVACLGWDAGVYANLRAAEGHRADALRPARDAPTTGPRGQLLSSPGTYLGVYEPGELASYRHVSDFAARTGRRPNIVLYYSTITTPFQDLFANQVLANGAVPLIQLNPGTVPMKDVAAGREDRYLKSFAEGVRSYGHHVIIGFASEQDGSWDKWGYTHTPPQTWIAGWDHLVTVFRQAGADNVTWLWTVNAELGTATGPLHLWWPGRRYVTWVGIDGYYFQHDATFTSVFGSTIRDIRKFTNAPILLSEIAIGPVAGPAKIPGLIAGVRANHLLGFVWYDQAQHHGIYHQDWRLEDDPAALAAFRTAVKTYSGGAPLGPVPGRGARAGLMTASFRPGGVSAR